MKFTNTVVFPKSAECSCIAIFSKINTLLGIHCLNFKWYSKYIYLILKKIAIDLIIKLYFWYFPYYWSNVKIIVF